MVATPHHRILARRASNIENASPTSISIKRISTTVSVVVADISRRRRVARATGLRTPKYLVGHTKRRLHQIREMPPAAKAPAAAPCSVVRVAKHFEAIIRDNAVLRRPQRQSVSTKLLASIHPDLGVVPEEYIRDKLTTNWDQLGWIAPGSAYVFRIFG